MSGNHRSPSVLFAGVCLAVALLLGWPDLAGAAESTQLSQAAAWQDGPLFAGWFSQLTSGLATRSNVVRVSIGVMALALFIMMKKFDGSQGSGVRGQESGHKPDAQARGFFPDP